MMSKRAVEAAAVAAEIPEGTAPSARPRISGITYTLGPDQAFSTQAIYRYAQGQRHPAHIRLDGHRYGLLCGLVRAREGERAGPEEVALLLHDVYYCLYAPRPLPAVPAAQTGHVPDRA